MVVRERETFKTSKSPSQDNSSSNTTVVKIRKVKGFQKSLNRGSSLFQYDNSKRWSATRFRKRWNSGISYYRSNKPSWDVKFFKKVQIGAKVINNRRCKKKWNVNDFQKKQNVASVFFTIAAVKGVTNYHFSKRAGWCSIFYCGICKDGTAQPVQEEIWLIWIGEQSVGGS